MRAFVAIELDAATRTALGERLRALQEAGPPVTVKWVSPDSQHLTLQFLGEIGPEAVEGIARALERAALGIVPFDLTLAGSGCFPNAHRPNVLWVAVAEPSGALERLQRAVGTELRRIGFPPEARPFSPHLTLARVSRQTGPRERRALGEWFVRQPAGAAHSMRVSVVHLMQSDLRPAGAQYTALHAVGLPGVAHPA